MALHHRMVGTMRPELDGAGRASRHHDVVGTRAPQHNGLCWTRPGGEDTGHHAGHSVHRVLDEALIAEAIDAVVVRPNQIPAVKYQLTLHVHNQGRGIQRHTSEHHAAAPAVDRGKPLHSRTGPEGLPKEALPQDLWSKSAVGRLALREIPRCSHRTTGEFELDEVGDLRRPCSQMGGELVHRPPRTRGGGVEIHRYQRFDESVDNTRVHADNDTTGTVVALAEIRRLRLGDNR